MCGIIMGKRRDNMPVGKAVLKRYHKQRERGHEGFGFLTIDNGKISGIHRFEKESDATTALGESKSSSILFHHRLPTSTPNYKDMTHPITVKNKMLDKDYYVVHNGVLQNEDALRLTHEGLGFSYTTAMREISVVETISGRTERVVEKFNDSEALAIEIALFLDGKKATIDARGTIAFVCVETDKQGNVLNIHYGNNGTNPLVVEDNNDLLFIKSTGDGAKVDSGEILTINYSSGEKTFMLVDIGQKYLPASRDDEDYSVSRVIGFGAHDRDVPSPKEFLPPKYANRQQQLLDDDWGETEEDVDWQAEFDSYRLSEEYLLDLWGEMEVLEKDMVDCQEKLANGVAGDPLDSEDIIYNQEYYDECLGIYQMKDQEAQSLERYLKIKRGDGTLIK